MNLKNDYKVMYEAKERVSVENPGPIYASQDTIPSLDDAMLISYRVDVTPHEYINVKNYKVVYSVGKCLYVCVNEFGHPDMSKDIKIVLKDRNGNIILGDE